jgi:hypothetical protein
MQYAQDMISEHTGLMELFEWVPDGVGSLATAGADVFAFAVSEDNRSGDDAVILGEKEDASITDFGKEGTDSLDLRDLLQGEESGDLAAFLNVTYDGTNTVIKVSNDGSFTGEDGDAGHVDHTITLEGKSFSDFGVESGDSAALIQQMIDNGQLNIDQ